VREVPDHDGDALKLLADGLRSQLKSGVALLASRREGKALFLVMVTEDLVKRGIHAGKLVRTVASVAGGGGGGRGDLAQAGAKNPELVPEALQAGQEEIEKMLRG
jgi:alanyl-tRNA synthetase